MLTDSDKQGITPGKQDLYDAFNSFVFSGDKRVMAKLLWRARLFNEVKDVPGDILECGVFKGSGIMSWLKIRNTFTPNAYKKVVGFDFFDSNALVGSLSGQDKEAMAELFKGREFEPSASYKDQLFNAITQYGYSNVELIAGDVSLTSKEYADSRPGAKISLLYMDVDLAEPTYNALTNLWPLMSEGGYVVFDEYGYHVWSESRGVDRFVKENGLKLRQIDAWSPTAYLVK